MRLKPNTDTERSTLSRRERQIMDAIYKLERATAAQVHEALPDAPSYSSVRTLLGILEAKGHLRHSRDGARYVYAPTSPRQSAARSAVRQLLDTFFGGSVEQAVSTLLTIPENGVSEEELDRLARMIDSARESEKKQ